MKNHLTESPRYSTASPQHVNGTGVCCMEPAGTAQFKKHISYKVGKYFGRGHSRHSSQAKFNLRYIDNGLNLLPIKLPMRRAIKLVHLTLNGPRLRMHSEALAEIRKLSIAYS